MDKQPSEAAMGAVENFTKGLFQDRKTLALAFDAYATERERAARADALEQACKAVCWMCNAKNPFDDAFMLLGVYRHIWFENAQNYGHVCDAHAIRALMNEDQRHDRTSGTVNRSALYHRVSP